MLTLLIMFTFILIMHLTSPGPDKQVGANAKLVVQNKQCPPHQWFWQEIEDQNSNKLGQIISCKVCGPLKSNEE